MTTAMLRSVLTLLHTSFKAAAQDSGFTPPALLIIFTPNKAGENITDYFQSKKEGKDQEPIQSSTTPDPGYQTGKNILCMYLQLNPQKLWLSKPV